MSPGRVGALFPEAFCVAPLMAAAPPRPIPRRMTAAWMRWSAASGGNTSCLSPARRISTVRARALADCYENNTLGRGQDWRRPASEPALPHPVIPAEGGNPAQSATASAVMAGTCVGSPLRGHDGWPAKVICHAGKCHSNALHLRPTKSQVSAACADFSKHSDIPAFLSAASSFRLRQAPPASGNRRSILRFRTPCPPCSRPSSVLKIKSGLPGSEVLESLWLRPNGRAVSLRF
jgi:hypothetical protein